MKPFTVFLLFCLTLFALFPDARSSLSWEPTTAQDYFRMGQTSANVENCIRYLSKAIELNPKLYGGLCLARPNVPDD
jgi:hypothetical protein